MCDELATIYLSKRFYLFLLHLEFSPIVLHLLPCMITARKVQRINAIIIYPVTLSQVRVRRRKYMNFGVIILLCPNALSLTMYLKLLSSSLV